MNNDVKTILTGIAKELDEPDRDDVREMRRDTAWANRPHRF